MKTLKFIICVLILSIVMSITAFAEPYSEDTTINLPNIQLTIGSEEPNTASTIQVLVLLALITLAPSMLVILTSFTRVIIALHFLRSALGTQSIPPNQIIIGLAVFITIFIMGSTFDKINENAFKPYSEGTISQEEFVTEAMKPLREFMFNQVEQKDLALFTGLAGIDGYDSKEDIPNRVLIPSFILGELTKGFKIGFMLYIPFIVIDMVVSSTLMAMGMMMLPPALISAPFKLLLFIMVDGWSLVVESIVRTFVV